MVKRVPQVFISYVRENSDTVKKLAKELCSFGIDVWLDHNKLKAGLRWADAIRKGISNVDFFIACFSGEYNERSKTYMNEELTLAIEELRRRPIDKTWFIPVLLSKCNIPNRSIGGGETLRSFQWVELYRDWDAGIQSILSVIKQEFKKVLDTVSQDNTAPSIQTKSKNRKHIIGKSNTEKHPKNQREDRAEQKRGKESKKVVQHGEKSVYVEENKGIININ